MEKERPRELKRPAATTGRLPLTKAPVLLSRSNAKRHYLSGTGNDGRGVGGMDLMEGWKKDKVKGARGSSSFDDGEMGSGESDGGDDEVVRPPPAASITTNNSSKRRVKLNGKVADNYIVVDPALVPRKLRSAIHKRSSESASPPVQNVMKKFHHAYSGINGVKRSKQSMVTNPLTKDEEEVIETLSALASIVADTKPIVNENDRRFADENVDIKATTLTIRSEAAINVMDAKYPFMSINGESTGPSHDMESLEKAKIGNTLSGADALEQPKIIVESGILNIDLESKDATEEESQGLSSSMNGGCSLQLNGGTNISYSAGTLLHVFPSNGKFQLTKLEGHPSLEPEIGLLPRLSAQTRQKIKTSKERSQSSQHVATPEEATSNKCNMVPPTSIHGSLTELFSTKTVARPDSACCVARSDPAGNDSSAEKFFMDSAHRKGSWKKCVTHVYISHLIRKYQNSEKKQHWHPPAKQLQVKEGRELGVVVDNELIGRKNGLSSTLFPGITVSCGADSKHHELNIELHQDRRIQPEEKHPTTSGTCSQTFDFMSLSSCCESGNPGKKMESSGQRPVSYLHPLPPHHHMMPFPLPPGHYPSPYPEQLAAQQLPHYVGHPFYGLHIGHAGGSPAHQQQRQQLWQAHLTNYRPPLIPMWQNGRPQDPSLVPCPIPSSSSIDNRVASRCSNPSAQQILPIPFPATNVKRHHQQIHHNQPGNFNESGILRPEGSAQLQLLCNAQRL